MKKSNVIIFLILVISSIFLLWLWYYLDFDAIDHPRDLVLSILWWIIVVVACIGIHFAEKIRQKNIRTSYLAPGLIYNSEAGITRFQPPANFVTELQQILDNLKYNFARPDEPNQSRIRFDYVVRTDKFKNDGDTWKGEVVKVRGSQDPIPFDNREELASILGIEPTTANPEPMSTAEMGAATA